MTFIQIHLGEAKNPDLLNPPIKHRLFHHSSFHELVLRMQTTLLLLVRHIFLWCLNLCIISEFPSANLIMIQTIHCREITIGWFPRLGIHRLEQISSSTMYHFWKQQSSKFREKVDETQKQVIKIRWPTGHKHVSGSVRSHGLYELLSCLFVGVFKIIWEILLF